MKKLLALLLMMAICLAGSAAFAEAGEAHADLEVNTLIEDGSFVIQIDVGDDLNWVADELVQDDSVVKLAYADILEGTFVARYEPTGDGEISVGVRHYTGIACDHVLTWDLRVVDGAVQEVIGGGEILPTSAEELDPYLSGEWLEVETQFTRMTIEKNPVAGWDVEIASPLTHGANVFKTTVYYDCEMNSFVYDKGKFWDVPITEEENPDLGEAKIAGTTGRLAFTGDEENPYLSWYDDQSDGTEVFFERADAGEAEAKIAADRDVVYGYLGDETVKEQAVYNDNGVKITVTGLEIVRYAPVLELRIENASGRRLGFSLSESALNGWMWDASLCTYEKNGGDPDDDVYSEEIDLFAENGETLDCGLGFANEYYYEPCGIVGFGEIGFALSAYDPNTGDTLFTTPVIDVETSLGADYPGLYRDIGTLAYEANDLRIVIAGLNADDYHTAVRVYINNYSDVPVIVTAESCAVNGVETEPWFGAQVSPGRQCLAELGFDGDITVISRLAVAFRVEEYTSEYTENPAVIGVSDVVEVEF